MQLPAGFMGFFLRGFPIFECLEKPKVLGSFRPLDLLVRAPHDHAPLPGQVAIPPRDIVEVPKMKTAEATRLLFDHASLRAEPTGERGLAAVLSEPQLYKHRSVCCVVSGGNVCPSLYRTILACSFPSALREGPVPA